ncbi:MAG: UDP-glucose 4-epimerase GalE [Betaproteobacteria bacterium]
MRVLVTGGLGYIGSHACVAIAAAGHAPVVVDNLVNSKLAVLERIRRLSGAEVPFYKADLRDRDAIAGIIASERPQAVMHFAALKAVSESVEQPLRYYENNVGGTLSLMQAMKNHGVRRMVFSSSAAVYGEPRSLPIREQHPLEPANPYGWSKVFIERLLVDEACADAAFRYCALRYFNPVGAHPSGEIGEDPRGEPQNLFPRMLRVLQSAERALGVHGGDYPTADGTGVRDYIHIMDLVQGHVRALEHLAKGGESLTVNLGTGQGYSVLQAVQALEAACGRKIPVHIDARRPGDVAACYADPSAAQEKLGWRAGLGLSEMCADLWRWHRAHPLGYPD